MSGITSYNTNPFCDKCGKPFYYVGGEEGKDIVCQCSKEKPLGFPREKIDWKARAEKAEVESNRKTGVISKMSDDLTKAKARVEEFEALIEEVKYCAMLCKKEALRSQILSIVAQQEAGDE